MSNIDNTTLPTGIGISESQYKEFMREIKAMKPNKRKNWKNTLLTNGVLVRVASIEMVRYTTGV